MLKIDESHYSYSAGPGVVAAATVELGQAMISHFKSEGLPQQVDACVEGDGFPPVCAEIFPRAPAAPEQLGMLDFDDLLLRAPAPRWKGMTNCGPAWPGGPISLRMRPRIPTPCNSACSWPWLRSTATWCAWGFQLGHFGHLYQLRPRLLRDLPPGRRPGAAHVAVQPQQPGYHRSG